MIQASASGRRHGAARRLVAGSLSRAVSGLLAATPFLLLAGPAPAQTVRPVVVQLHGTKVQGKLELVNDGLAPISVVLEPQSFDVTEQGEAIYRPLDPRIRLRLSGTSFRIPPRQSRFVFYEARADSLPAWFVIPCTFVGPPATSGLQIQVELPHTVYMVQKEALKREDIEIRQVVYSPGEKGITVDLENVSPRLGRALEAEISGKGMKRSQPSFPLVPRSRRHLVIPWDYSQQAPDLLTLRFQGFRIDLPLADVLQVTK